MAVTRIRKISSWTLLIISLFSVGMILLFFLGGEELPQEGQKELKTPIYTGELLYWIYCLFAMGAFGLLIFGIIQFINSFRANPKAALLSLCVLIAFAGLLGLSYSFGDGTPIASIKADSDLQAYNVEFWLKVTEMWLYSMYILLVLVVLAVIWGSVKKVLNK